MIRSQLRAQAAEARLKTRLRQAQAELAQLNESKPSQARSADTDNMQVAAAAVLKQRRVAGLFKLTISE